MQAELPSRTRNDGCAGIEIDHRPLQERGSWEWFNEAKQSNDPVSSAILFVKALVPGCCCQLQLDLLNHATEISTPNGFAASTWCAPPDVSTTSAVYAPWCNPSSARDDARNANGNASWNGLSRSKNAYAPWTDELWNASTSVSVSSAAPSDVCSTTQTSGVGDSW